MSLNYHFGLLPDYIEKLMAKLRIAVVYGGDKHCPGAVIYKTHNPRSTKTYEAVAHDVAQSLRTIGFQHIFVMADDMTLAANLKQADIHLVWLNTGGVQGYNPVCHTPALLEMLGMPYVGHNPLNSSILDNKHAFKRELQGLGFPTAPFMIWHPSQGCFQPQQNCRFNHIFSHYSGPFVVKPVSGRASLHIRVVNTVAELSAAVAEVQQMTHNTVLIEKYLPGREFCVSVCGYVTACQGNLSKSPKPFTFSAFERVLEADEPIFTSMDKKAITQNRLRSIDDEELALKQTLIDLAQRVYWDFSLNSLVRLDLRTDAEGNLQILEANPKPDLKRPKENITSLVAQGLSEYGMSYDDLILSLLADRLDYLLTHHVSIITHITDFLV
ncbi:MAG: ATP-grasp domain-containing protein [Cyanothece sp. SIO1E1]|nr:ATP-grasp domain-containing protein [Cyanothece sp. SIO1E1]